MADAVLGMVLDKLGTMALDELRSLKDVSKELEKLQSTLSAIRSVLEDAEARSKKERALVDWLKKLKDVAYYIDDVLDEAAVEAHQFKSKDMVRKSLSFPKSLLFQHEIAKKIKEIRKRLDMISEEKSRFQLREGAVEHSVVEIRPRETGFYVDKSQVYGRDEDKRRIIDFLLNKFNEKNLGVISIVGLGGLGKTTLAQLVYNDDGLVSQHFANYKIWVHVSEKFEIKNVITTIIESLTKKPYELSRRASMEEDLLKHIKGKRFLLVLDDVWTEDYNHWDSLEHLLNRGDKGSKVIVTTRSRDVAYVMKSYELHILSGFSDDDCWKLFENRAFVHGVNANNRNLVAIGKEIVKKCGGLPLAATALGSALCSKREENQWRAIRDNETWTLFKDNMDILPALMLSYNHLLPCLKQCFAYCSIFPKGTEIEIKMLGQLWLAKGFVSSSDASQYVDQLISRSLLENVVKNGYVYNHVVKMHDMVHNLAKFVAGDECSIIDATSESSTNVSPNSRYTSLILNKATPSPAPIQSCGQKLRTLNLIYERFCYAPGEEDFCQNVLSTIFSNMKLLRALHLPRLAIKELPAITTKLVHLRYLDLSYTRIEGLPQTISLLYNLQTLKLHRMDLKSLPKSIGDLVNLLTLDISFCLKFHSLPDTIGKLIYLQYLGLSWTNLQTLPPTIGTLHSLQTLHLSQCYKLEMLPESIGDLENLLILDLSTCKRLHSLPKSLSSLNNLETLDLRCCCRLHELPKNLQSMRSLRHLHINGCHILTSMPAGIGQFSLQMLPIYVLGDGENDASLAELGTLMNLEGPLHIKNLQNVKDVAEASAANLREKQSIYSLGLEWDFDADWKDKNYEGIDDFEKKRKALMEGVAAMDGERVRLLEDVSSSLQPHQNLRDLRIKGYVGKMLPRWMMDTPAAPFLVRLELKSFARCDNLQALEQLSSLEFLELKRFPFIECLPRLGQLPCLKSLRLSMLPGVKCLGSELYGGAGAFPALKWLKLKFMLGLEEWSGIANEGGDDFLPHLSRLFLRDCPKLLALPSTFPSVEWLEMNADDELLLCYLERGAFPNLTRLFVDNCVDTEDESSMPEALVRRLNSIGDTWKYDKLIKWNHSRSELEKMRLETLERIATEIEKKLAIKPS